jgi:hypothetical protein
MNDPHVSALLYRVKHGEKINYDKAEPLEHETESFRVSIKDREARFEMKEHFPTAEQAREVVEPFIHRWEFTTALDRGPAEFELAFLDAVVEDRKPTPGVVTLEAGFNVLTGGSISTVVGRAYPQPPTNVKMNADVEAMALRYSRYREGKDTLAGMAYFCLTVLEEAAGNRSAISSKFGIASSVVTRLGQLTGEKGGAEARKGRGRSREFTAGERSWIEQTTNRLIRRAAEVAYDPTAAAPQITMSHLPVNRRSNLTPYRRPILTPLSGAVWR